MRMSKDSSTTVDVLWPLQSMNTSLPRFRAGVPRRRRGGASVANLEKSGENNTDF